MTGLEFLHERAAKLASQVAFPGDSEKADGGPAVTNASACI